MDSNLTNPHLVELDDHLESVPLKYRSLYTNDLGDPEDITYGALLRYDKCPFVFFFPQDGDDYSIFELEISTSSAIYSITNNGATIRRRVLDRSIYGHYLTITDGATITGTTMIR